MKENSISGDNRFEIIEKAKEKLLNATNIEDSKEEMKVLTNILFRMWQAGLINEEKLEINKLQKENSIEEDITRVKQRIEDVKEYIEYGLPYSEYLDLENSFDNILSDYKRVLKENEELLEVKVSTSAHNRILELEKENEELKRKNETLKILEDDIQDKRIAYVDELGFEENYIPVQKVQDKIEELNDVSNAEKLEDIMNRKNYNITELVQYVLQELLEGRKENEI